MYSVLKRTHLEHFFHHTNNLHQNIKFTVEEESNGELAFLDALLKRNNGEISALVYRKPTHTDQYLHYSSQENGYQESIISKIFKKMTNNYSLPQSQQLMQEEEIRMSINLPYVEGTSEILRHILRSHKIRSTLFTEKTLHKLLCKPKNRVATEDKTNIVYEIDCINCEAVYFGECKRSLKSRSEEHKRSARNCDCDKNEIATGKYITTLTGIRRKINY